MIVLDEQEGKIAPSPCPHEFVCLGACVHRAFADAAADMLLADARVEYRMQRVHGCRQDRKRINRSLLAYQYANARAQFCLEHRLSRIK